MYLTRLSLTEFRTFSRLDLHLPKQTMILVGSNAQGKTSILEAINYLATLSSFNTSFDRQLINFNIPQAPISIARIVAEYQKHSKKHTMEIRLIQESNGANSSIRFRKEVLLDGVKRRLGDIYGHFNAVIFLPQMSRIIEGGPSERRSYLDNLLSQVVPHYGKWISDYDKTISQRNALLKTLAEHGGDVSQLEVWDGMLARSGAAIIYARIHSIKDLEQYAQRIHQRLTSGKEVFRLAYQPSYEPLPQPKGQMILPVKVHLDRSHLEMQDIQSGFQKQLHGTYREDIARGITTLGPHRDELRFISNQIDLGDYGSRGQARTALLSMKLAELQWMHDKTGEWPVLLLDEIMSELDPTRRSEVLAALTDVDQALLTSTDPVMFGENFIHEHEIWKVDQGMVVKQ